MQVTIAALQHYMSLLIMSTFVTQVQEVAQDWVHLGTEFVQQQAQVFQAPLSSTAVPNVKSVAAGFVKAAEQADEFVVKAVKLADAHGQKLLDAALDQNPARNVLAPFAISVKNASQAVVTVVEQIAARKKSLYRAQAMPA
jgi:glucose/arabinose dehydrogenase